MNAVYIIDFSNFAYKFKSVYTFARVNINSVDVDTSVLVGFIRCLRANLADNIVIVLDGTPARSLELMPSYKGQRMKDDVANFVKVPKLETIKFLTKVGSQLNKNIKVVCSPLQETDEVVASLVAHITGNLPERAEFISMLNSRKLEDDPMLKYLCKGKPVLKKYKPSADGAIIASTDGDFIQLQRWDNVWIDTSSSGKNISAFRSSKSTFEVSPAASVVYKVLYGDASDNIPALDIPWRKEELMQSLTSQIKTDADLEEFYQAVLVGNKSRFGITKFLHTHLKRRFNLNWEVAFLKFRSYPYELEFQDYDINETIKKYKLKI